MSRSAMTQYKASTQSSNNIIKCLKKSVTALDSTCFYHGLW